MNMNTQDRQAVNSMLESRLESLPTVTQLPPGYFLVASRPRKWSHLLKILACNPKKGYQPFVVWTYNRSAGGCSNGTYFATLEEAELEFLSDPEFAQ